jgi:hypothetical protein
MVITIPVVSLFLKEKPQMMGLLVDGETGAPTEQEKPSAPKYGITSRE